MEKLCIVYGIAFVLIAGCMCMPSKRMFLDIDCDEKFDCDGKSNETDSDSFTSICATDGHTYDSKCHMNFENQRRYCVVGDFNPIAFVHEGNCTDREAYDMMW